MTLEELGEVQGRPWDDVDVSLSVSANASFLVRGLFTDNA